MRAHGAAKRWQRVLRVALVLGVTSALGEAPVIPPAPKWAAPVAAEKKLASGARLWVVPRPGVPLVHVEVVVASAGSRFDPPNRPGLAALTATALEEGGAGALGPPEFLAAFDALGSELDVTAGLDGTVVSFSVMTTKLEAALRLLGDLLGNPGFNADAFRSAQKRRLAEIAQLRDDPARLGGMVLAESMYGSGPRGHLAIGTEPGVSATTLDDIKGFYKLRWQPSRTTFVLAGDISAEAGQKLLDATIAKPWVATVPLAAARPEKPAPAAWVGVDKPGAAQTVIRFGRPSIGAKDPKVPAYNLVATVLGGSFTSRLTQNIREKRGYAYNINARLSEGADDGALFVVTSVKSEVTAEALTEIMAELTGIASLTPAEHAKARALLESDLVSGLGSGAGVAATFAAQASVGLGPDKLSRFGAELAAVDAAQLSAAAAEWAPDGFTVVLVGDRARIEKGLSAAFPKKAITWRPP